MASGTGYLGLAVRGKAAACSDSDILGIPLEVGLNSLGGPSQPEQPLVNPQLTRSHQAVF